MTAATTGNTLRALWGSSHPGPTLVVTALAGALGVAVGLDAGRLALLVLAVFAGQLSVGISNDALDAPRDRAVGRRDKPLARGDASVRQAWAAASVALAVALGLSALLGWRMLAAHALMLGGAWAYNAGLKATAASLVPFLVSFGIFPSLAPLSAVDPAFAEWWAWIGGAALGAAFHLTNVLPDLDDDARTGVRGLPHRIDARLSALLACVAVVGGAVAVLLGPVDGNVAEVPAAAWIFFGAVLAVVVVTLVLAVVRPTARVLHRLIMLAALVLAVQLVASGAALAA